MAEAEVRRPSMEPDTTTQHRRWARFTQLHYFVNVAVRFEEGLEVTPEAGVPTTAVLYWLYCTWGSGFLRFGVQL